MAEDSRKRTKRTTTWTRSKRSCQFCSSRKQRCELPQTTDNFETVFSRCLDSDTPLPEELRCERCRGGKRDCVPAVPGFGRQSTKQSNQETVTASVKDLTGNRPGSAQSSDPQDGSPDDVPEAQTSIPNTSLNGLMRDIPSENVSSVLFPHCSGVFPEELRLSPLAILPCLCRDAGQRQRELQAKLSKFKGPTCDHNGSLDVLIEHDALQLLFDCFPGLDCDSIAAEKEKRPILHNTLKYSCAFVGTGVHRYLNNCGDGAAFILFASPDNIMASMALLFLASYVPIEVAPVMPPAQDMNFLAFANTVNATGLLKNAALCTKNATFTRPSTAYLQLLSTEVTHSFLAGDDSDDCKAKLREMKRDLNIIETTDETKIAVAVLRCRVTLLEISFEAVDYLQTTAAQYKEDLERWDAPTPFAPNFTEGMRAKGRAAISSFCRETNVDHEVNRHPVLSTLHALAARLELVVLLKSHYLTIDPLIKGYSKNGWRFVSEGLMHFIGEVKFNSVWKARELMSEVARRLLIHANDAFDTRYPTIIATREMMTAVALASKQLLETHVGRLSMKRPNEDEMQSDGLLLRQTAQSVGRAETILAKALASTVDSMAKALKTWQNKLVKLNGELSAGNGTAQNESGPDGQDEQAASAQSTRRNQMLQMLAPDSAFDGQIVPDMTGDWDNMLTGLLGPEMDWNWIAF